jgi:hypothetical protein
MQAFFRELGQAVLSAWKRENFSPTSFPGIAARQLEKRKPCRQVALPDLIREFLLNDDQPPQTASGFGQPELIVFEHPRFYVQVLFWLDGTTQIHQHEFSGAFHVLAGSSLHSEYSFENAHPVTAHFRVGDLRPVRTELLETGRTVQIQSGGGCIHSLFHLESPSLTVVVRTHSDPGSGPQFTYLPPHVAVDPFFTDALTSRRTQLLDVLEQREDPAYAELVRTMIADLDFERGFFVLQNCYQALRRLGEWERTWKVFARRHGTLARKIPPTLEEIARRDALVGLRATITHPPHRFFLALLLNVPDLRTLQMLIKERFGGDPTRTIMQWAEELSETSEEGTWILDARFPEGIGIAQEHQLPRFLDTLHSCLRASPAGARRSRDAAADQAMRAALRRSALRVLAGPPST